MRNWKRLFYYLLINVVVSAITVLIVLSLWDRARAPTMDEISGADIPIVEPGWSETPSHGFEGTGTPSEEVEQIDERTSEAAEEQATPVITEYQVQSGDTLGGIASRFGLSLELLMEANNISDPNRVDVGQLLVIPQLITATLTATQTATMPTATATPRVTATAPEQGGEAQIIIDSVIGAGDLANERVMLKRSGSGELSLEGWQLVEEGGLTFTFPQFKLFEAGAVYIYTRAGQSTSVQLFWGLDEPVWQPGELVTVLDDQGQVRATYRVP
ncbi:MAG: LysM peptidoglycan-binding domain-containing protein [Anaerolineales bacterium]|nr:LysM peptidoglycan-binding domain-containing protein [Anaerolineales bacterium]